MCKNSNRCLSTPALWSKGGFTDKYVQRSNVFGTGAFSKVHLGSNIINSEDVAVKVIDRSALCEEEEERLVAEIDILRELSHTNILSEFVFFMPKGCVSKLIETVFSRSQQTQPPDIENDLTSHLCEGEVSTYGGLSPTT